MGGGSSLFLAGLRLETGELFIVATNEYAHEAISIDALRWEIEILLGCLKGRGFHFEDTHITDRERIKKLLVLLSVAYAWSCKIGEWQHEVKPIPLKKHGRFSMRLFRYGLDYLAHALFQKENKPALIKRCLNKLKENFQYYTLIKQIPEEII